MRKELMEYLFYLKENNLFHTPQSLEMQLSEAISAGNVPLLQSILGNSWEGALGTLSHDADRQVRYMFVTAAAVFARAAMRGGMNYELACSMADVSCQQMDALPHIDDLTSIMRNMAMEFCRAINEENNIQYSQLVNDCCIYIYNHSHETIPLEDLARVSGLSTRRLSLRFREETGMSIGEYIHQTKIDEAKLLLQYTDHSVGEIAFFMGYCNQSHFSQVFKSVVGVTPMEFKQQKLADAEAQRCSGYNGESVFPLGGSVFRQEHPLPDKSTLSGIVALFAIEIGANRRKIAVVWENTPLGMMRAASRMWASAIPRSH